MSQNVRLPPRTAYTRIEGAEPRLKSWPPVAMRTGGTRLLAGSLMPGGDALNRTLVRLHWLYALRYWLTPWAIEVGVGAATPQLPDAPGVEVISCSTQLAVPP